MIEHVSDLPNMINDHSELENNIDRSRTSFRPSVVERGLSAGKSSSCHLCSERQSEAIASCFRHRQ
jgi:hypothetical protein